MYIHVVTFGLKTSLHVLGEHNSTKTELYRTNTKSQGLVPAHFALIIIIVVHVYSKTSISINKYMQKAGEIENDAGFLKHIYCQLNCSCSYPKPILVVTVFLGCTSIVSLSGC